MARKKGEMKRNIIFVMLIVIICWIGWCEGEGGRGGFEHKRIGIIGSGAAGSSVAYHARKLLGEEVDIEIFEKQTDIGGRVRDTTFHNSVIELGGSIYHVSNKLISQWVKEGNFTTYNPISSSSELNTPFELGIWDGEQILFQSSSSSFLHRLLTKLRGLFRYSFDAFFLDRYIKDANEKFNGIYDALDDPNLSFTTVNDLLNHLQLADLTTISLKEYLQSTVGICKPISTPKNENEQQTNNAYCDEILTGLTRVNYGQSIDQINALAGMVALIGSGDDVYSVLGGNRQTFSYAIRQSNSFLRLSSPVETITKREDGKYDLEFTNAGKRLKETFDVVVIASPLEHSDIHFVNISLPNEAKKKREFQRTYVTMVSGDIKLDDYFGQEKGVFLPNQFLTTENSSLEFTSLFPKSYDNKHIVYKFFSRSGLSDDFIDRIIQSEKDKGDIFRTDFYAYPKLKPTSEFPPFILDDHLYYVNAFEFAFSTIESEIASGKNIAKLIRRLSLH